MSKKENGAGSIAKDTLALVIITLVAALILGFVREITAGPIAEREEKTRLEAYALVYPGSTTVIDSAKDTALAAAVADGATVIGADYSKTVTIDDACIVKDASGNCSGYIITVTDKKGYGGNIQMTFGYSLSGEVLGIAFLQISETAGFGLEAEKNPEWRKQFYSKNVSKFTVTKSGAATDSEIDALSGATITSTAVTEGMNAGLAFAQYLAKQGIGGAQ